MGVLTQNYEIIRELGRGGMGAVYLANDKRLGRQVAIKMLHFDSSLDEATTTEIIQRFQKEARAIAHLSHPNIVNIYDIGEEGTEYYMVIELLEGQALSNIVEKKEKLSIDAVINIGIQICNALAYAHKNGIVHRDIKPANIMYSEDHVAKLTDFGIAQLGNDKMGLTQAGSILGSILYIPPEQLVDSRKVDQRADIYSFGVTLFQLFTGRLPFEGDSVAEVITKILNHNIPSMKQFDPDIPDVLDKVILKAMKKEPADRFSEVSELGKALGEISEYLKNPNYKLDSVLFSNAESPVKPNTNILIKPGRTVQMTLKTTNSASVNPRPLGQPASNPTANLSAKEKPVTKPLHRDQSDINKDVTPQKISTGSLNKITPLPLIRKEKKSTLNRTIGIIAVAAILITVLFTVFAHKNKKGNKPVIPVNTETNSAKIIRPHPARKQLRRIQRPVAQLYKPKLQEVRKVARTAQNPVIRKPVARIITHKETPLRKQAKTGTSSRKSIGEGY